MGKEPHRGQELLDMKGHSVLHCGWPCYLLGEHSFNWQKPNSRDSVPVGGFQTSGASWDQRSIETVKYGA